MRRRVELRDGLVVRDTGSGVTRSQSPGCARRPAAGRHGRPAHPAGSRGAVRARRRHRDRRDRRRARRHPLQPGRPARPDRPAGHQPADRGERTRPRGAEAELPATAAAGTSRVPTGCCAQPPTADADRRAGLPHRPDPELPHRRRCRVRATDAGPAVHSGRQAGRTAASSTPPPPATRRPCSATTRRRRWASPT